MTKLSEAHLTAELAALIAAGTISNWMPGRLLNYEEIAGDSWGIAKEIMKRFREDERDSPDLV